MMKTIISLFSIAVFFISTAFCAVTLESSSTIFQGDTGLILATSTTKLRNPQVSFEGKRLKGHLLYYSPNKYIYRVLLPTTPFSKIGLRKFKFEFNSTGYRTFNIRINKRIFKSTTITIPKKKKGLMKPSIINKEANILGKLFRHDSKKGYWKGVFIWPAQGRTTGTFGDKRIYTNGNLKSWHKGIDIAGKMGDPVVAPNDGMVIYAGSLKAHGNTIVIDHGHNVISVMIHLNKVLAKKDQFVKKGKKIAILGTSGISTGPHVHWGLSVNNKRVNPAQWVDNDLAPNYFD
jgi:murein DD-endopeptidase MepM/ murein hydrolase activator NlpD